ncbi:MAG TPA: quinohemoprotein amine dehydrogenase maturation protein [Azospirillum sp.]|nr:quinohemoprotein amine dehydrogenase maturation protein [Azospirillum sp.]
MTTVLRARAEDLHEVAAGGRPVLFHVPSSGLFDLDEPSRAILELLRTREAPVDELVRRLDGRHAAGTVREAAAELLRLRLVQAGPAHAAPRPAVPTGALTTLVLNVTSGCNLACTYCYKEDLRPAGGAARLSEDAGRAAVDLLLSESGSPRVGITYFGGEPLTNLPLIKRLTDYAERRAGECGRSVDFSLTTNGTLLDDAVIAWLDEHRFGITVSIDGPAELHDRNRRTPGGHGTHAAVEPKVRRLLERFRSRPVGARVTVTSGGADVALIHRHLKDELGFAEVGFAPVTAGMPAAHRLGPEEERAFFDGLLALGCRWRDAARQGRDIGFSNLSQLIGVLHQGAAKRVPCGAGLSLLAVDTNGTLELCHRFAGSGLGGVGDVRNGPDRAALAAFLERAQDRAEGCASCWVRHLCAGGCYHEAHARHGDLFHITDHYCDPMREWIAFGIGVYVDLMATNPGFLRHRYASGRTAA